MGEPGSIIPSQLRHEVRLLERILFAVLDEDAGPGLVDDVANLRAATIQLRSEPSDASLAAVVNLVDFLDEDRAEQVARAFTIYFQLVNLAEEHHRVHDLRDRARTEIPLHESIAAAVADVREQSGVEELAGLLERLEITPVLTAHPTEARRRAVVEALERVAAQIAGLDDPRLSAPEEDELERRLAEEIAILWRTDQVRPLRPSPLDEVRAVMALFDETIFRAAPSVYRSLDRALNGASSGISKPSFPAFLRWNSWVGADRDGNPSVTGQTTRLTAEIQADHVLRGLENVARRVARATSASDRDVPPSAELLKVLDQDEHVFPDAAQALRERVPDQAHRRMLLLIAERIAAVRAWGPGKYDHPDDLVRDLQLVQRSLAEAGAPRLAYGELQHLVWQTQTFGFHLASLEVRQHAGVHRTILEELAPGTADDPVALNRLATQGWPEGTPEPSSPESQEVLETFSAMADIQGWYGADACRRYIVSFTRTAADVVAVRALARLAVPDRPLELDVVPLFESHAELAKAPAILDALFEIPGAAAWLDARGRRLEVMMGYSDSAKEAGFLAANVALYRTQEALASWAKEREIALTIFHGRGGALGRGGGPTNRAIAGQAPGSVAARFKVTEQGEVTFWRYANLQIAGRHLEQVTNAVLLASTAAHESKGAAWAQFRDTAGAMADASSVAYQGLVSSPGFVDFFIASTPIEEIGELPMGSRPARRAGGAADVESLRAIPWVFAWAQARVNLPGWFGLGTGLQAVIDLHADGLEVLRDMYQRWPFFTSLLQNAELSLVKADMSIAQLHFALGDRPDLAERVIQEYDRTVALVLAVSGHEHLLAEEPRLARDIDLRNPSIDALSFLQIRFLRSLREDELTAVDHARVLRLVQLTVSGIAAGLQNTG